VKKTHAKKTPESGSRISRRANARAPHTRARDAAKETEKPNAMPFDLVVRKIETRDAGEGAQRRRRWIELARPRSLVRDSRIDD